MQKIFFNRTSGEKISGIVIVPVPGEEKAEGKKYLYIDNTQHGVSTFCSNMKKKFPSATHINFYCKKTGNKIGQIHLL